MYEFDKDLDPESHVTNAKCHFYADDTVLYCSAPALTSAIDDLQSAFKIIQQNLQKLRLVLNPDKTKMM